MQKIAVLYDASQAVLSTFDLDEVLNQILMIARDYFHLQNVAILLLDKNTQELQVRSQIGWDAGMDELKFPLDVLRAHASDCSGRAQRNDVVRLEGDSADVFGDFTYRDGLVGDHRSIFSSSLIPT